MSNDMTGLAATGLLATIVFGTLAYGDYRARPPAKSEAQERAIWAGAQKSADQRAIAAGFAARPSRFTKAEFSNHVYGMTKAQLKAQFGSPDVVFDSDGSWFYMKLPVYDADAGIQVSVTVGFMGIGGPEDEVAYVSY